MQIIAINQQNIILMKKLSILFLGLVMAICSFADVKTFKPNIFGGDYEYVHIDSLKRTQSFVPSTLYELQKDGKHIGYAVYLIGFTDYSSSSYTNGELDIRVRRNRGNHVVYFLGATKQQAIATIEKMEDMVKNEKSGMQIGGLELAARMHRGKTFYEEHVTMLSGDADQTLYRVRRGTFGEQVVPIKGVFISKADLEPAFITVKEMKRFKQSIETYQEPAESMSWEGQNGNGEVLFSNTISVIYIGNPGFILFRREYTPAPDAIGPLADKNQVIRKYWTYTFENPTNEQGALVPLGDDIDQAISTSNEVYAKMLEARAFYKNNKVWLGHRKTMPKGYIYFDDLPLRYALDGVLTVHYVLPPPMEWFNVFSPDRDSKIVECDASMFKRAGKILVKEKKQMDK